METTSPRTITLGTFNAQGVTDPGRTVAGSILAAMQGIDLGFLQEVGPCHVRQVLPATMGVHQVMDDAGTKGVAAVWNTARALVGRQGLRLGVEPHGRKMHPRWLAWSYIELENRLTVCAVAAHRPPARFHELTPAFDRNLATLVENSPHPVIVGMDSNDRAPLQMAKDLGLAWSGVGIDGFLFDPRLAIGPARKVRPSVFEKSDHDLVIADLQLGPSRRELKH